MGQSADAILFYGYVWDDEHDIFAGTDIDDDGWVAAVARRRGHADPWLNYPSVEGLTYEAQRKIGDAWTAANRAALDAWRDVKASVELEFAIEVFDHCSSECRMPAVAAMRYEASRGNPVQIDAATLTIDPAWDERLDRWFAEMGVKKPHDRPGWYLVSYWG